MFLSGSILANRYDRIWAYIKKHKEAKIRCRPAKIPTIVLAVKKIKSAENRSRIDLELGRYGKLQIVRTIVDDAKGFIEFKLLPAELAERL